MLALRAPCPASEVYVWWKGARFLDFVQKYYAILSKERVLSPFNGCFLRWNKVRFGGIKSFVVIDVVRAEFSSTFLIINVTVLVFFFN